MNSENLRVLTRTASLLTNHRSLKSLENLLLLAVEGFGDLPNLPFLEKWAKRINILKKKATENGIDLKEYTPRFVCRLAVKLAKATVEFESNVANDLIYRFRPMKPVLPQDSRIFRIYIPMNFEILFLKAYLFSDL